MKAPSEKHLEDWIVANPEKVYYQEEPYEDKWDGKMPLFGTLIARQAKLPSGICDLIATDMQDGYYVIYAIELKKGAIDSDTICQCLRYIHDLKDLVQHTKMHTGGKAFQYSVHHFPEVRGIVVGHWLKDANVPLFADAANILPVTYEYDLDAEEYVFTAHGIPVRPNHHDPMIEYSYGIIGQSIKQIVHARIEYHKANPNG